MAGAIDDASAAGQSAANKVTSGNSGAAVDAFGDYWQSVGAGADSPLAATAEGCRVMATALHDYADQVRDARRQVIEIAVTIAATMAAGIGLGIVTFGIATAAASAATAALCASVGILEGTIAAAVVGVVAATLVGAVFGAIEAFAVNLVVTQGVRNIFHPGTGFSLDEAAGTAPLGALFGGAFLGGGAAFRAFRGATGPAIHGLSPASSVDAELERLVGNPRTLSDLRTLDPDSEHLLGLLRQIERPPKLLKYLERVDPTELERRLAAIRLSGVPQGMSEQQFLTLSQRVRELAGHLGDDIRVGGSRAAGASDLGSDLDLTVMVSPSRFDEIVANNLRVPNPGSNAERRFYQGLDSGKLEARYLDIDGLGNAKNSLGSLSGLRKVSIAVVREGSKYDNGPWIMMP